MAKYTLEIELSDEDAKRLLQNSIERVMNNAIKVGAAGERELRKAGDRESASILWQDCEELLPLVRKIWWSLSDTVRSKILIRDLNGEKS